MTVQLSSLVAASQQVAATRKRLEKRQILAALLLDAGESSVGLVVSYLTGHLPQGRVGLGPALLKNLGSGGAEKSSLTTADIDAWVGEFADIEGSGAKARRRALLEALWKRATVDESAFLFKLFLGELRQGALDGVLIDAIAQATAIPTALVRRATMLAGSPVPVAEAALRGGEDAVAAFRLMLMQPLQPMLAQPGDLQLLADSDQSYLLDYKLDGARVQVHREGDQVRIFTRQLHDVTASLPEVVDVVRSLNAHALILDGEAIALRENGAPHPFQTTMRRFGRRSNVEELRAELPLNVFFFDCLHLNGEDLIDQPLAERLKRLDQIAPEHRPPRLVTDDVDEAAGFLAEAFDAGHEGIMVKNPDSPYAAGSRGADWTKIKQVHTFDLVVLAAEWGSGRRQGWLSNLHLGARDPQGGYVMLGKTFKGLTDDMLRWQTEHLLALETSRDEHTVHVRPELVVEIAVNEIQQSPQYPAGMALRFARVKAHRGDKSPADADSIDAIRALFSSQQSMG